MAADWDDRPPWQRRLATLRVVLSKRLLRRRYDYREEWLRFARTIGANGAGAPPLGERAVQSLAEVTGSPAGLLLMAGEAGELVLAARWNWVDAVVPGGERDADYLAFLERDSFVADLDQVRAGRERKAKAVPPAWLLAEERAWALVPLIHYGRLVAVAVLARPAAPRKLDWEDFDVLRVIGRQLASYLAEHASQEALAEASRFDDFHRRIAFVMHDIKNLASQLSLLARNAQVHAEKKAFREDMIVTLRSATGKLDALIARLSRYGGGGAEKLEVVAADEVARGVAARFSDPRVVLARCSAVPVAASRHALEQVLVHLIQNALDASADGSPVFLSLTLDGAEALFEVVDSGHGMSPEFVRSRLFKPFVSTKPGGFGIGAYEARELVRAMAGRIEVESREGIGTRFAVRLPVRRTQDRQVA